MSPSNPSFASDELTYDVTYTVRPDPAKRAIEVTLELEQTRYLLRQLSMDVDERISTIEADGDLERNETAVVWRPPTEGGRMTWRVAVNHRRNGDGYDAWFGKSWGLFRAEDLIPRAATRTLRSAVSNTRLVFELPRDWTVVTQYYGRNAEFVVANPERRFDQPSGWITLGDIGVRRETIAGIRVGVAGPVGHAVRRLDALALLNWTLPELVRIAPNMPDRLTVFSAGDPMWRGGLSAPQSLFIHADRPLISENATSTLLHEVMHLAFGVKAADGYDWIVEGFAEYYSLELLARSGSISRARHAAAQNSQRRWATTANGLCAQRSSGATTALAVTRLIDLNNEIQNASGGTASLDDVAELLTEKNGPIDLESLTASVVAIIGRKPDTLRIDNLPGCRKIDGNAATKQAS